jgi:hypothetical protein
MVATRGLCRWGTAVVPCGASVLWLKHDRTAKSAPIDAEPAPKGNVAIDLHAGTYRIVPEAERAALDGELYTNHWATCPAAQSRYQARKHREQVAQDG